MGEERKQSPHYIPELDPESEKSPRDAGMLVYVIYILLPFSLGGTLFGIKDNRTDLLFLGLTALAVSAAAILLILHVRRKQES